MQAMFHLGVHGTDGGRLFKDIKSNQGTLSEIKVEPIPTERLSGVFSEALHALQGGAATQEMEELLLDAIQETDDAERLVFSFPGLLGVPARALSQNGLYSTIDDRMRSLINLIPSAKSEFALALLNPVQLIRFIKSKSGSQPFSQVMHGLGQDDLSWSTTVQKAVQAAAGRRLLVWCHEDTPIIWPDVIRAVCKIPDDRPIYGQLGMAAELVPEDALKEARKKIRALGNDITVDQRRNIFEETLVKYADPERTYEAVDLPGWGQDLIDAVTEQYYDDLEVISEMPGVEFINP